MKKAYLLLENGKRFEGVAIGATEGAVGELVFTTGVCGYIETLTDPAYYGQIVMQTFPLIGNYGMIPSDAQGKCALAGYVVRDICDEPSNFRAETPLEEFLRANGIPGIAGIDTRALTQIIREEGVMRAKICYDEKETADSLKAFKIEDAVQAVTTDHIYKVGEENAAYKVTLVDYGTQKYVIDALTERGCAVTVVPAGTSADEIMSTKPDGILLSNGPGNPADCAQYVAEIGRLFGQVPMLGIGLGHQLMALARGGRTVALKYGHRGSNQPVRDLAGTRTYMSEQNHGYAVVAESVLDGRERLKNLNDGTCEGIDYPKAKAFSVQVYPTYARTANNTSFVFDRFVKMVKEKGYAD